MVDLNARSPTSRIVVRIFRLGASDPSTEQLLLPGGQSTVKTDQNRNERYPMKLKQVKTEQNRNEIPDEIKTGFAN